MSVPGRTEFLDRGAYRQRRWRDAAKGLPVFAIVLMLVPLLWPAEPEGGLRPSALLVYVFGVWAAFVVIFGGLAVVIRPEVTEDETSDPETTPERGQ